MKTAFEKVRKHLSSRKKWMEGLSTLFFLSPMLFFFIIFLAFPVISTFYMSMTDVTNNVFEPHHFIFLDGYIKTIISDASFHKALENQLLYAVSYFLFTFALSLTVAILLNEIRRANDLFQVVFYLPMIIPLSIVGGIFLWIFSGTPSGFLNIVLKGLGLAKAPYSLFGMNEPSFALYGLMIARAWKMSGFTIIIFLAGLKGISPELREAAAIDGASRTQELFKLTIPLLKPYLFIGSTWIIINSMKEFDLPAVMTRGGPGEATLTLYFYAWELGFGNYQTMARGAQVAYIITILIFLLTLVFNKLFKTEPAGRA